MNQTDIPRYAFSHPDVPLADPRDKLLTLKQRENYRKLARVIYSHIAQSICSPEKCDARCKRLGRCAYVQPKTLSPEEPNYVAYNLRHRDMPQCLAATMDENVYDEIRALVLVAVF